MLRKLGVTTGAIGLVVLASLLVCPLAASAAPVPLWHNTLENDAAATIDGGALAGDAPTYAAGQVVPPLITTNKFVSNASGDSWVEWGTTEVQTIFGAWNDPDGITVDLYFSGIDSSTHSGNSGLWSVGHRGGDNFVLIGVLDDTVRINFRNEAGSTHSATAGGGFIPTETYRLTLRQHSSLAAGAELYLDDLNGNVYDGVTPLALAWDTPPPAGFVFNFPLEDGAGPALGMTIGNRHPFASEASALNNGEAIDEVRVFNGNFTPAQLDIPEPAAACLLVVALPLLFMLRTRRA